MGELTESFQQFLDRNSKIVAKWPEWKRKILVNNYGEPSSYADYAYDYYRFGPEGIEITDEFPELSDDEAAALLAKSSELLQKSNRLQPSITYTLGPNGIEQTVKDISTEEAIRTLRNYDRLRYEDRTKSPVRPISKKEPQTVAQKSPLTRADQLQIELDQEDTILDGKESAIDQRFASLELE